LTRGCSPQQAFATPVVGKVQEVRKQFADGKIMAGTKEPDYGPVIDICTAASLRELTTPALLAVLTPVIMDCVWVDLWPWETDQPPADLYTATGTANPPMMARCTIPRHGGRGPASASHNFNPATRLPQSGINIGFADGHAEMVKLERLWDLYWHLNWNPPSKRPGLP